jgi:hypothetical protein
MRGHYLKEKGWFPAMRFVILRMTGVKGAGFSYLFRTRKLAYNDVLTMMIATSDNFCTNLIIQKLGWSQ